MRRKWLAAVWTLSALTLAACTDALGPGNAANEDREELLALLEESGFFADDFGVDGAVSDATSGTGSALVAGPAVEAAAPRHWGRRRGRPVGRVITVDVDREAGTAMVTKELEFDGKFLLDITDDAERNPTEKPLREILVQHAKFERVDDATAAETGRRWRLVGVSPTEWVMTAEDKRTVDIGSVEVWVDGVLALSITDPSLLFDVDGLIPHLRVGQEVQVKAFVSNSTRPEADTYVFLHLFHASPDVRIWIRVPMELVEGDLGPYYERSWVVRHSGRGRVAVDAIDSQTFMTDSDDDYRANIWGIPYIIEGEVIADG